MKSPLWNWTLQTQMNSKSETIMMELGLDFMNLELGVWTTERLWLWYHELSNIWAHGSKNAMHEQNSSSECQADCARALVSEALI